ncbi:MAG: HAD family hydrolase, partial [Rubricella sp.]
MTPMTRLRDKRFVLATDLDGTFLGGSDTDRRHLYSWIEGRRHDVGLVFVTGRDPAFILELCAEGFVPTPDYVIGDVGTTVAEVTGAAGARDLRMIEALEADIAARWGDAGPAVREALRNAAGLRLQDTPFRYRVSYHYDPDRYDGRAETVIREMGHDVLISDNRYFDVLPKGVSKGPTLERLIAHL